MCLLVSVSNSDVHRLLDAIRGIFSSNVSLYLKDDNVIFGAGLLLTRLIVRAAAHPLLVKHSVVLSRVCWRVHDAIRVLVFLHFEAIVAEALGSSFHNVDSCALAVPVPLINLSGSHVEEARHSSDL